MTTIDTKRDSKHTDKSQELILTLTPNEEIVQFNKECEQLTGYLRGEVLHRKFSEILLPTELLGQWKTHLDSIRQTLRVDEFILPIKTKDGQTYAISWNGILIGDTKDSIKDICLFGQPQKTNHIHKYTPYTTQMSASSRKEEKAPSAIASPTQQKSKKTAPIKHNKKKILFASENETKTERNEMPLGENLAQPLENIEKSLENTSEKLDSMNTTLKVLTEKYDTLSKRLEKVEKKEWRTEKNHRPIGERRQLFEESIGMRTRKQNEIDNSNKSFAEEPLKNKKFTFFSDPFGFKRRHRELTARKQQIETQMSQLNIFQNKLINERKAFNARVEEFCKWREKLELLELAIEKRRQELMNQEEVFFDQSPASAQKTVPYQKDSTNSTESKTPDSHEFIEKISQSAAIIQRGIIKRINTSFATLLGYSIDEIVEKSFFDLIAQDGLADIEKYYLERLKGEDITVYRTVFSTKDNNKIAVEVNIKQTLYNGEKAEIAIITNLSKSEPQETNEHTLKKR
jgi:PAS domain S-box-containing protein